MKKIVVTISLLLSFIALTACSSSPKEQVKEEKSVTRMRVVSSGKPAEVLPAFTTFTWSESYSLVLSAVSNRQETGVKAYIRKELINYLQTKGYRYQPDPAQADMVIGFLFALKDDRADNLTQNKFGLPPSEIKNRVVLGYQRGTFLLTVLDSELKKVYWRSVLQGLVDLEKDMQDANSKRMSTVLDIMMGGFSKAGR